MRHPASSPTTNQSSVQAEWRIAAQCDNQATGVHQRSPRQPAVIFLRLACNVLIKAMKMMDRPVAVADVEAIGCRNRSADPDLGITNRGFHGLPPRPTRGRCGRTWDT